MPGAAQGPTFNAGADLLRPALAGGRADRPAILFDGGAVTYAALEAASNRFAGAVRELGVGRQERVFLMLHDRPEFFAAYLGALKAGAVVCALNVRSSAKDLRFAVEDGDCRLLVLEPEYADLYRQILPGIARPPAVLVVGPGTGGAAEGFRRYGDVVAGRADTFASEPMRPEEMALWMYTSGTTGTPKAAVHRQSSLLVGDRFLARVLGLGPEDRLYCSSKLFFAFSLGHCFLGALRLGAAAVLHEGWPSPQAVAATVARHRPSVLFSVPTFYRNLLAEGLAGGDAFRTVRRFVSAGEKLPEPVFERWRAVAGMPILEGIGATENLYLFLAGRPDDCRAGSCGVPVPETEVRLLDDEGRPVTAPGTPGIAWVRSDTLADGYWNQPDKTAAAFRNGWYRTGDMFVRDDAGRHYHQGRGDDMLKISGQWVSPSEIEDCALHHPLVAEAAVVGAPNRDGLVRLALFLRAPEAHDPAALEAEIKETLTRALSIYKCPRRIVLLDDLPRTATGKVQRFRLRQMAEEMMRAE
jgi:benzoate-CoA ligase